MSSAVVLIAGMAVATYFSRVAPFYLLPREGLPHRLERLLFYVPPAAIGALIFPGVLSGPDGYAFASLLAAGTAAAVAMKSKALWLTVGTAIVVTFLAITAGAV